MTAIPPSAQQAAQNALNALIDGSARDDADSSSLLEEDDVGQVLEVNSGPPTDVDRTVFEDPKSFNVKVRLHKLISVVMCCYQYLHYVASALLFLDVMV